MKVVVCGAGPVGALAGLYAANRGYEVEIYELRGTEKQLGRSINLTLGTRGLRAIEHCGDSSILKDVLKITTSVFTREVHGQTKSGKLNSTKFRYSIEGKPLEAIDRTSLRDCLLSRIMEHPNIKVFLHHKLVRSDMDTKTATFADMKSCDDMMTPKLIKTTFDLLIGADGAHSAVRYQLSKIAQLDMTTRWVDIWWCDFRIPLAVNGTSRLNMDSLHVWPQKDFIFIALPNLEGDYACNLFAPRRVFDMLGPNPRSDFLVGFFQQNFPGVVPNLITPDVLIKQYLSNPPHPLHDFRVSPVNNKNRCVLVGDAAHTMTPFYGQGLNTGLEDVRILFEQFIDSTWNAPYYSEKPMPEHVLSSYSIFRQPDVAQMNDFALANYTELSEGGKSKRKSFHVYVDQRLQSILPALRWTPLYNRVVFTDERFTEIRKKVEKQHFVVDAVAIAVILLFMFLALFVVFR